MQPAPQAYWDAQRNEVQVIWGIGGRRRHFRLPPRPANLTVLTVEAVNDTEVAVFYGREGGRPEWVQVVAIMSGGVHQSTNWQPYLSGLARRAQHEHSLLPLVQQQQSLVRLAEQQRRRSEQQERDRQRREAEGARQQREQQRRALAVRPRAQTESCRADVPSRRDALPGLPTSREFVESRQSSSFYYEDEFDCDNYHAEIPRLYATVYDVTPKTRRSNRTSWTWLGGLIALIVGLVGLVLSASAPSRGPMPMGEALAFLSAFLIALFGLIGMIWPRIGGFAVLVFATLGAGRTDSASVRVWMAVGFISGLLLWFGRRNRARRVTMRKLVRVTVLAGVAALVIMAISR